MPTPPRIPDGLRRVFADAFRVADIAEPLASFDEAAPAAEAARLMAAEGYDAVGIRRGGRVWGFAEAPLPADGPCGAAAVRGLAAGPRVFVTAFGGVAGIVTRADLLKAPVRMWLFGLVTLIELRYTRLIAEAYPDGGWTRLLSAGRVAKAEELLAERRKRRQELTLLDCLQLADKRDVIVRDDALRAETIFGTKREAEDGIKMLEGLRNSLAHSQDIVASDWDAIVRLTDHLDRVLNGGTP